jgi:trigger factor
MRPEAEQEIRIQLLLEEVARAEEIEITNEDLDQEYDRLAQSTNQPVERVRQFFREEERLEGVKTTLRRRQAMDIIVNNAKIT